MLSRKLTTTVSIIGLGHLGSSLCHTLHCLGYPITNVVTGNKETQKKLQLAYPSIVFFFTPEQVNAWGEVIFITVPDRYILFMAETCAKLQTTWEGHIFIHCSGAVGSESLQPLADCGADTAAWHPIQTFSFWSDINTFANGVSTAEGSKTAIFFLHELTTQLKMSLICCPHEQRQYIHLASVMASNYLITVLNMIQEMLGEKLDIKSHHLYTPILFQTLANIKKMDLSKALTGPLVRGDIRTIQKHVNLLNHYPRQKKIYLLLAKETLFFIEQQQLLSKTTSAYLRSYINSLLSANKITPNKDKEQKG